MLSGVIPAPSDAADTPICIISIRERGADYHAHRRIRWLYTRVMSSIQSQRSYTMGDSMRISRAKDRQLL